MLYTPFYAIIQKTLISKAHLNNKGENMDWLKVKIYTTPIGTEMVSAALYSMGIYGLEIFNPDDYKMPEKDYTWDYIDDDVLKKQNEEAYVCAYIGDSPAGVDQLNEIKGFLRRMPDDLPEFDLGRLDITVTNIQNEDWVNNWKKFFKPMEVGNKFLIVPEWETVDNALNKLILTINPGGIFGTGSHETTQLCISAIENVFENNKNTSEILDIGTGSGILSIASLLLGARYAECIDIDPNADTIVAENMAMNNIAPEKYSVKVGNILDNEFSSSLLGKTYDIIAANIMADIIISMLPVIPRFMSDNSVFITSGIIESRLPEVQTELTNAGFKILSTEILNEWCCITSKRA